MSDDYVSPIPAPPSAPLADRKCPICDRPVLVERTDGGSWCHGDQERGGSCNAILKVQNDMIICVARRLRMRLNWK